MTSSDGFCIIESTARSMPKNGRRDRLVTLIRWLPEAVGGGARTGSLGSGPDSKALTFGPLYYANPRSWDELFRCLQLLEAVERKHLVARFHGGTTVRQPVRFLETRRSGIVTGREPVSLPACSEVRAVGGAEGSQRNVLTCILYRWPTWVSLTLVDEALASLERLWEGPLDLPRELIAA